MSCDFNKNYYSILEVDKKSSIDDIKKSYKKLALKHHPDKGGNDKAFSAISEAYDILSDDNKKLLYDKTSPYGSMFIPNNGGFGGRPFGTTIEYILNIFGRPFTDGDHFNAKNTYHEFKENLDINVNLIVTTRDVYKGIPIKIEYKRYVHCSDCDGTGFNTNGESFMCDTCYGIGRDLLGLPCKYCRGTGKIFAGTCKSCKGEKIIVKDASFNLNNIINIRKNSTEVLKDYGHQSKYFREKKGVLNLNIVYEHLPKYELNDEQLIYHLNLHYEDAINGVEYEYIHLDNSKMIIKIPARTKDKDLIRIRDKGLFNNINKRGDLLFKINIVIDYKRVK